MDNQYEILELDELDLESDGQNILQKLQQKQAEGYSISILLKTKYKLDFQIQTKKNNLFSKKDVNNTEIYQDFTQPDQSLLHDTHQSDTIKGEEQNSEVLFNLVRFDDFNGANENPSQLEIENISPVHQLNIPNLFKLANSLTLRNEISLSQRPSQNSNIEQDNLKVSQTTTTIANTPLNFVRNKVQLSDEILLSGDEPKKLLKLHHLSYENNDCTAQLLYRQTTLNENDELTLGFGLRVDDNLVNPLESCQNTVVDIVAQVDYIQEFESSNQNIFNPDFNVQLSQQKEYENMLINNPIYILLQNTILFIRDGNYKAARDRLKDIVDQSFELVGRSHHLEQKIYILITIQTLCYQNQTYRQLGQFDLANKYYLEKCQKHFEINDPVLMAQIYSERGQNSLFLFKYQISFEMYRHALEIYQQLNWKLEIAHTLNKMGYLFCLANQYENAQKVCFQALTIQKEKLNKDDYRISVTYDNLAEINFWQNSFENAEEYLTLSQEIKIQTHSDNHQILAKNYNLRGMIKHKQGLPKQAVFWYEQAIKLYGNLTPVPLGQILNNYGLALMDRMQTKSARLAYERAIKIYKIHLPENHPCLQRVQLNKFMISDNMFPNLQQNQN